LEVFELVVVVVAAAAAEMTLLHLGNCLAQFVIRPKCAVGWLQPKQTKQKQTNRHQHGFLKKKPNTQ